MSDYFTGEIRMMANTNGRPPNNWKLCNGDLLLIREYQALYALIGTAYGGDGVTNFGIPDLRGRLPVGQGQGTGLTNRVVAQSFGAETVSLVEANLPAHNHALMTAGVGASTPTAGTTVTFANTTAPIIQYLKDGLGTAGGTTVSPAEATIGNTGSGLAHANIMPCATVNFIICVTGLFPTHSN